MREINFKLHEARDIDYASYDEIFVELTPESGLEESTPQLSRVGKLSAGTFYFDTEDQFSFTLLGGLAACKWKVKIYLKEHDSTITYDGASTIKSLHETKSDAKLTCELIGTEISIGIGLLAYSWTLRKVDEEKGNIVEGGEDGEQGEGDEGEKEAGDDDYEDMIPGEGVQPHAATLPIPKKSPEQSLWATYAQATARENDMKRTTRPVWSRYSQTVTRSVRADMAAFKSDTCVIAVKIHFAMFTPPSAGESEPTAALLKLSLQPAPARRIVLHTKKRAPSKKDGAVSFSFHMRTATLAMSVADMHSKAYGAGCAPVLQVEFMCGKFSAVGALYLPALLNLEEGKLIALHLVPKQSDKELGHTLPEDTATPFGLNSTADGNASVILEVSRPAGSVTKNSLMRSFGRNDTTEVVPLQAKMLRSTVHVNIKGIYGSGLKDVSSCFVETSLCASGTIDGSGRCSRLFVKGVHVNHEVIMHSDCSDLDVLQLKVYGIDHRNKIRTQGVVQVPLSTLLSKQTLVSGCLQAVHIEPSGLDGANSFAVLKWGVICDVSCEYGNNDGTDKVSLGQKDMTVRPAWQREVELLQLHQHHRREEEEYQKQQQQDIMEQRELEMQEQQRREDAENDMAVQNADEEDPVVSHIAKRQFAAANSVDGRLSVCVQGFVPRYGGPFELSVCDVLSIEFSLPNSASLKEKTEAVKVCHIDEGDAASPLCALWEKEFMVPVVWSVQQRFVGCLQGVLIRTSKSPTGVTTSNNSKGVVGYVSLDLASVVNMKDKPIVCALPVVRRQCSHEDYQDSLGYVMLGLQFDRCNLKRLRCTNVDCEDFMLSGAQKKVTLKKSVAWGDTTTSTKKSSKPATAMSPLPLPPSAFSVLHKLCLEHWPLFAKHLRNEYRRRHREEIPRADLVHVSVSLNSIDVVAGPLRSLHDDETIRVEVSSNDAEVSAEGSVDVDSGKISLRPGDIEVPLNLESNTSILIYVKIIRNSDNDVMGVSSIVLPRDLVITGRSTNIAIPLRDDDGLKTAVIICGCHFSSAAFHAITAPTVESIDPNDSKYMLNVCVVEGSVRDGEWTTTLEPYFECSLVSPYTEQKKSLSGQDVSMQGPSTVNCVGYTPTVDLSSPGDWNARCSVPIPADALMDSVRPSSLWSLAVKCRDGARLKYPQIAHTQVSVPWSVVGKGESLDVWVNLIPSERGMSILDGSVFGEDRDIDDYVGPHFETITSRIHIRLERSIRVKPGAVFTNLETFPGVGQIAMWYHSIREGESRSEKTYGPDNIRTVEAVVQMSNSTTELTEFDEEHISFRTTSIDTRQSTYGTNYVADMLSGKVVVPGGRSVTYLRLTTTHEKFPLVATLPTLSTLPNSSHACPDALSTDVPLIETVLRTDRDTNHTATIRHRMARLKLGAVFVPYVTGFLYIFHSHLEVHESAASTIFETPLRTGALKFSLGGVGNCFSSSFRLGGVPDDNTFASTSDWDTRSLGSSFSFKSNPRTPSDGRKSRFKRSQKAHRVYSPASSTSSVTSSKKVTKLRKLVATQCSTPSPRTSVAPPRAAVPDAPCILVNTFDMLSGLGKSSDDTFDLRISLLNLDAVGKGYCVGVGHIQTAAIYYQALRRIILANKKSKVAGCTMPTHVKLFDPVRHAHVATVTITLKFELTAVCTDVINFLRAYKHMHSQPLPPATGATVSRAELGLKQAFQLADKDNSGGVSASYLATVIHAITSDSNKGSIVGFEEGAIRLLLTLMEFISGPPPEEGSAYSEERIRQLFKAMDLDGDGQVSWWEWRQVLDGTATMMTSRKLEAADPSRFIDALDPLVVTLEAAHAALMAQYDGIIAIQDLQAQDDDEYDTSGCAPGEKKCEERVARLKHKNSCLVKKLAEALSSSSTHISGNTGGAYTVEMSNKLKEERRKRADLEAQLERMKDTSSEMERSRSQNQLERADLATRLAAEANRLREEMIVAYMGRKFYERKTFILKRFFLVAREKILSIKLARETERRNHAMRVLIARKRYLLHQQRRYNAAATIQNLRRRFLALRRVARIRRSVLKIHELVTLRKLRKAAQAERYERLKQLKWLQHQEDIRRQEELQCQMRQEMIVLFTIRKQKERHKRILWRFFVNVRRKVLSRIFAQRHQRNHIDRALIAWRVYVTLQKAERQAAVKIQQLQRRITAQREKARLAQLLLLQNNAALVIQICWKNHMIRKGRPITPRISPRITPRITPYITPCITPRIVRPSPRKLEDDVLILKHVQKPALENAVGLWISHPCHKEPRGLYDEREALVDAVDLETMVMHVRYMEEEPIVEAKIHYNDPKITHWLKMSTPMEEREEIQAAVTLQSWIRGWYVLIANYA